MLVPVHHDQIGQLQVNNVRHRGRRVVTDRRHDVFLVAPILNHMIQPFKPFVMFMLDWTSFAGLCCVSLGYDVDFIDKLNYHYTSGLIFGLAVLASAKEFVGYPIQCWIPPQFTAAWEQYTEDFCYVDKRIYWHPLQKQLPTNRKERKAKSITYYKFVPFVLAIESMLFYAPCMIWRGFLQWPSGIDVQSLTQMAADVNKMNSHERASTMRMIAGHMEDALDTHAKISNRLNTHMLGRRVGGYVTFVYLFTKALYVFNVISQIYLINAFLGAKDFLFGYVVAMDLWHGRDWEETGNFPRVSMCDFEVRVLGNLQHHTVQCVLPINMFNEKIFLFLWFWLFVITVVNVASLGHWAFFTFFPQQQVRFVRKYIQATELSSDFRSIKYFANKFLGFDGVFCLKMVSAHAGELVATELVVALWRHFVDHTRQSPIRSFETTGKTSGRVRSTHRTEQMA